MKRGKVLMTVLVVLAVLFASCSNGMSKDDADGAASTKAVKVGLNLKGVDESSQKTVSLKEMGNNYKCFVTATPRWDGSNIQNPYDTRKEVGYYSEGMSLGYFTPGTWQFDVEIWNYAANPAVEVYYGTAYPIYISPTATNNVEVDMELFAGQAGANGTVKIKVAVPSVENTALEYAISNSGVPSNPDDDWDTTTANQKVGQDGIPVPQSENWTYFAKDLTDLAPGNYTLTLNYKDGNESIGGATVAFTIRKGDELGVYGTIEEGQYQIAALTLNIPNFNFNLTGTAAVLPHATATNQVGIDLDLPQGLTATYAWYVNGGSTGAPGQATSYNLSRVNAGRYEVVCVATVSDNQGVVGIGFGSKIFTITAPANINFMSQVGGAGYNVAIVAKGGSLVCTPTLPNGTDSVEWYVGDTPQTAGVAGNIFTFGTSSTTTTGTAGNYVIKCKAYNAQSELIGYGFKPVTVTP